MEKLVRNLKLLWKSERMLGEIRLRLAARKMALLAFAALCGLFALGMLNLSVFFAIQEPMGPAMAALLVGLGNLLLAGGLLFVMQRIEGGPEVGVVEEVREMALADIEAEARVFQRELRQVREEIADVRTGIARLVKNPASMLTSRLLGPATAALTKLVLESVKTGTVSAKKPTPKTRAGTSRQKAASTRGSKRSPTTSRQSQASPKSTADGS